VTATQVAVTINLLNAIAAQKGRVPVRDRLERSLASRFSSPASRDGCTNHPLTADQAGPIVPQGEALAVGRMEGGLRDRVNRQLARFDSGQAVAPAGGHGGAAIVNEDHICQ